MTPPCCTRAWAKATGTRIELVNPKMRRVHELFWGWRGTKGKVVQVPAPTSAEWLAEITEASRDFQYSSWRKAPQAQVAVYFEGVTNERTSPDGFLRAVGADLRRALCAALNGKACERTAA